MPLGLRAPSISIRRGPWIEQQRVNGIKVVFARSSGTRKHAVSGFRDNRSFTCFSSRDRKGAVVVHPYCFDRIALILASMLSLSTSPAM